MLRRAAIVVVLAACLGGLGSAWATGTLPGSTFQTSGFLGDYDQLSKVPGEQDSWQWVRPGVDWKAYRKIMLALTGDKNVIVVSGEAEVLDGVSSQRLFAQVTTMKDAHLFVAQNLTWDDVREAATAWANQARARLDAARNGPP